MFCNHCGNNIPDDSQFCPVCGARKVNMSGGNNNMNNNSGYGYGNNNMNNNPGPGYNYNNNYNYNYQPAPGPVYPQYPRRPRRIRFERRLVFLAIFLLAIGLWMENGTEDNKNNDSSVHDSRESEDSSISMRKSDNKSEESSGDSNSMPSIAATDSTNMKLKDVAEYDNLYIGLSYVKKTDKFPTAYYDYEEDLPEGHYLLCAFFEIYNPTNDILEFNDSDIEGYIDDGQVTGYEDAVFYIKCDGVQGFDRYTLAPNTRAFVVVDFEVTDADWTELDIYCGNDNIWKLTSSDVSEKNFKKESLFTEYLKTETEYTKSGQEFTADGCEIVYDNFTVYADETSLDTEYYAVFEYTITNTGTSELDYDLVGYSMEGYLDGVYVGDADYILDENIDGYVNVFNTDTIQSGKSAKIYAAFEIDSDEWSTASMIYNAGYITDDVIGIISVENQ